MADKTVTIRPAGGTYTSLAAAWAGEIIANVDLSAAGMNGMLYFSIEGDWSATSDTLTSGLTLDGFTTDATHYPVIQTDSANRASTEWDTAKYRLIFNIGWGLEGLAIQQYRFSMTGLQITSLHAHCATVCIIQGHGEVVDSCLIANAACDGAYAFGSNTGGGASANRLQNSIALNIGIGGGIFAAGNPANFKIYNCTVANCAGIGIMNSDADTTIENCYSGGNVGADYDLTGGTITTCFSEDETEGTSPAAYSTDTFVNVGDGTEDVALVSGSDLINGATDLSGTFTTDINGVTRVAWDVGADEYIAAAGGVSIQAYATYYANMRLRNKMHTDDSDLL